MKKSVILVLLCVLGAALCFAADVKAMLCKNTYPCFPVAGKTNEMPAVGTPWIYGLKMTSTGQWSRGSIIDPESGSLYKCKITYHHLPWRRGGGGVM
jgi:uncharacterized protein (DUF2147 family)